MRSYQLSWEFLSDFPGRKERKKKKERMEGREGGRKEGRKAGRLEQMNK